MEIVRAIKHLTQEEMIGKEFFIILESKLSDSVGYMIFVVSIDSFDGPVFICKSPVFPGTLRISVYNILAIKENDIVTNYSNRPGLLEKALKYHYNMADLRDNTDELINNKLKINEKEVYIDVILNILEATENLGLIERYETWGKNIKAKNRGRGKQLKMLRDILLSKIINPYFFEAVLTINIK